MLSEPRFENRAVQPYVAIRRTVKMGGIGRVLPPLLDEVLAWLQAERIRPVGAPFFRYWQTYLDANRFVVDVGWPVAEAVTGEGDIIGGMLPAGQYAVILNTGPFDNLFNAYNALFDWAEENDISWQISADKTWGARVEHYLTDPTDEPDPQQWQAEIVLLVAAD
ncbi:MAG: GyrI-like domain-containing protein [Caldilineaceae bacterium]